MKELDEKTRAALVLVGSTLGPFYLHDPKLEADRIAPGLEAIAALDVAAAAQEWPFVQTDQARSALAKMQEGVAGFAGKSSEENMSADSDENAESERLVWEYRRLFVGPAAKPAPPWGSVYTDKDRVVFGASTMALRDWMRRQGIELAKGESDEPEDHIGTMLELLAWLAEYRPELVEEYLSDHLLTWSPHFLEQLEQAAGHSFYEGLAALTRASLEGMQEELEIEVDHPHYYR